MRTAKENKARIAGTRCPKCGRAVSEFGCRTVRIGEYCVQQGLWRYHDGYIVAPTPDPIGKHEQRAIDEYGPPVTELEKATDAALEAFTQAQRDHQEAFMACLRRGLQPTGERVPFVLGVDFGEAAIKVERAPLTGRARQQLLDAESEARSAVADTESALDKARFALRRAEGRLDHARRAGKARDR